MKEFIITFTHTEESTYSAKIQAENEQEAKEIFEEAPFDNLIRDEPTEVQGLDVEIISVDLKR